MKKTLFIAFAMLVWFKAHAQSLADIEKHRIMLPNGWGITKVGESLPLGDLPLNIAVSKTKKYMAVTNNGQSTQSIQLIDVASGTLADQITRHKSWGGIVFSADEKSLYASGGNDNWILKYAIQNNKLVTAD